MRARTDPDTASVPIDASGKQIPDRAALDSIDALDVARFMSSLQTNLDCQTFLVGNLVRGKNPANSRRIGRQRLFHEDMLAGVDGSLKLLGSKTRWRRQDHQVDVALQNLLIGIQPDKTTIMNVDVFWVFPPDRSIGSVQVALEYVGHRHQFDIAADA